MKFRTKTGRLTAYSFACGYIEQKAKGELETTIWHEHGTYHVRQHDHNPKTWGRRFWECFDTLAQARNCFNRAAGRLITTRSTLPDTQ